MNRASFTSSLRFTLGGSFNCERTQNCTNPRTWHSTWHISTHRTIFSSMSRAERKAEVVNEFGPPLENEKCDWRAEMECTEGRSLLVDSGVGGTFSTIVPQNSSVGAGMRYLMSLAIVVLIAVPMFAQAPPGGVAETPKLSPEEEKAKIHLPPGFELQLVASDPVIHKPMNICFDNRGRIWVTDTVEYPFPAKDRPGRDRILILDDFGPDGKAQKITVFAEGLNIPIGILPYKDGCIAFSLPNLWFFHDADGDGKADTKEVLYGPFDFVDTHGNVNSLTIGFDGWLYACHGFRNDSRVKGTDGQVMHLNSGNVFRMKLDGSHCEAFTRGQVNPFGMAWDPLGNLYTACCHSKPLTQLLRGAVYESFAKPHDGLGFAPHMNDFGQEHSTGLCGLVHYSADHFPKSHHGKLFMGDVVLNRINSYKVEYTGASPKAIFEKFLVSDDPWFRPVDLRLGPDGAIYIADFYNCIIGHYEVPLTHPKRDRDSGRIWRIVWKGEDGKVSTPKRPYDDLAKESVEKLVELLGHENLTVRMQAMHQLAERGDAATKDLQAALARDVHATRRVHAMWVLERTGALDDAALTKTCDSMQDLELIHACRLLAERSQLTPKHREWLIGNLTHANPMLRRVAADALGLHPHASSVVPLLIYLGHVRETDRHSRQVGLMAVRDHVKAGLTSNINPPEFTRFANDLSSAVVGAPSPEAAALLLKLKTDTIPPAHVEFIARHGSLETLDSLMGRLRMPKQDALSELGWFNAVFRGIQARGLALPASARTWAEQLADRLFQAPDAASQEAGANMVGSVRLKSRELKLVMVATDTKRSDNTRAAAFSSLTVIDPVRHLPRLGSALRDHETSAGLRQSLARTLATVNNREARDELLASLASVSTSVGTTIASGLSQTPAGCEAILRAIEAGKVSPQILSSRAVSLNMNQHLKGPSAQRLTAVRANLPPLDEKVAKLITERVKLFGESKPDVEAGAKLYTKHCAACHQLGGQGAKVGPQLDGIGARSLERLLEDTLDPNRNVDPAFRSTRISLKSGRDLQGLILREEGEVVVLSDNLGKEVRVEKKDIEEKTTTPLSPMPANWAELIPPEEMNHLLAYLLKQRGK